MKSFPGPLLVDLSIGKQLRNWAFNLASVIFFHGKIIFSRHFIFSFNVVMLKIFDGNTLRVFIESVTIPQLCFAHTYILLLVSFRFVSFRCPTWWPDILEKLLYTSYLQPDNWTAHCQMLFAVGSGSTFGFAVVSLKICLKVSCRSETKTKWLCICTVTIYFVYICHFVSQTFSLCQFFALWLLLKNFRFAKLEFSCRKFFEIFFRIRKV